MTPAYTTPDWPALLAPPERHLPYAYKLEGRLGLAAPPVGALGIDEKAMTADFVASTGDVDRTGDVMVVTGCNLDNYRKNPVWLLGHAQTMPGSGIAFPIGTAEAPDGTLKVWVDAGRLLARCHFHQATREAVQAFELVKIGVLRGCSIGFNPISPPVPLPPNPQQMKAGYRFDSFELLELSLVALPMNQNCTLVRRALDLGKIAGEPISAAFRKSLEFMAEPAPEWANGWMTPQEVRAARIKGEFREEDHPRAEDGKFGSGGGTSGSEKPAERPSEPSRHEQHAARRDSLDRLSNYEGVIPGWHEEAEGKMAGAELSLSEASTADFPNPESRAAFVGAATSAATARAGAFARLADSALEECEALGVSEEMAGKMRDSISQGVKSLEKAGSRVSKFADKVATTDAALSEARANLAELDASEPQEPEMPDDEAKQDEWRKDHDAWESAHDKWQTKYDRASDRADAAEEANSSAVESFKSAVESLAEEYDSRAEKFRAVFDKATSELEGKLDAEEASLEEPEPEPEPDRDEETKKQLARILQPLPAILQRLHAGIKKGTITMKTKAFPPKAKPDDEEEDRDEGEEGGDKKPPFKPKAAPNGEQQPAAQPADKPEPELATLLANLTSAIVSIQEAIQPKEVPVAAAPSPTTEPGLERPQTEPAPHPEMRDDDADPRPVDDPERDAEEREKAREAMERYRSGKPAVTKGYKRFGKSHMEYLGKVADHLDELAGMEHGTKWSGYHQTACKSHSEAMRKMCKELTESSLAEGGATVNGDTMPEEATAEEKAQAASAVKAAFGPLNEAIYSLTGKRIA